MSHFSQYFKSIILAYLRQFDSVDMKDDDIGDDVDDDVDVKDDDIGNDVDVEVMSMKINGSIEHRLV